MPSTPPADAAMTDAAAPDAEVMDARIIDEPDAAIPDARVDAAELDATLDAAMPDARVDASEVDATLDAAAPDSRLVDAEPPDLATPDAAPPDAEPECVITSPTELCDGIDNDCDDAIDEAEAGERPCGVAQVAVGAHHVCALLNTGEIKCWGTSRVGQLGRFNGTRGDDPGEMGATIPAMDLLGRTAVSVATTARHTCAVLDDDAVACWGYEQSGVLGPEPGRSPRIIDLGGRVLQVATGTQFACALMVGGGVKCWGENTSGQLGQGDREPRGGQPGDLGDALPRVDLGGDAIQIAAAGSQACALMDDGRVKCWGYVFGVGSIGDEPGEMGGDLDSVALPPDRAALELSLNESHACALLDDGQVACWGFSRNGKLGRDRILPTPDSWPAVDLGGRAASAIATGGQHTCAIIEGGLKCWGSNGFGQLGRPGASVGLDPAEMGDALPFVDLGPDEIVIDVAAGGGVTCARLDRGRLKCWGTNEHGQLGAEAGIPQPGFEPETMGENLPFVDLGEGRRAQSITAGFDVTCARLDGDALKCWGSNSGGRLGQGDLRARGDDPGEMGDALPPIDLGDGVRIDRVWTGPRTCALLASGDLKCWGPNTDGRLGLGDVEHRGDDPGELRALPAIELGAPVVDVAVNSTQTCALLENGQVKCWGQSPAGPPNPASAIGDEPGEVGPDIISEDLGGRAVRLAAGYRSVCALLEGGGVNCWGSNQSGELGLGDVAGRAWADRDNRANLGRGNRAIALAVGTRHACALLDTGQVKCWGENSLGQLGLGDRERRGDEPGEMGDALPTVDLGRDARVDDLVAASNFTCALLSTNQVKCWGAFPYINQGGGAGAFRVNGRAPEEMGDALAPTALGPGRVVQLAAGFTHACARFDDGRVKCWGQNLRGQLGLGGRSAIGDDPGEMGAALQPVDLGP